MKRVVTAASLAAFAGLTLLAGCATQSPASFNNQAYAPYDEQSNPFCGALGNCPDTRRPYAMRPGFAY